MLDLIIRGGSVCDGSGSPIYKADIGIQNEMIAEIGDLSKCEAAQIIDAGGRTVAPGFIDMHSHADCSVPAWPDMESALGQGITTCFAGHCGMGFAPIPRFCLEPYFEAKAYNLIIPQVTGGPIPGMSRVLATEELRPAFLAAYGEELDWSSFGEYVDHLNRVGHGCNLVVNVGHCQLRHQVMGYNANRAATPEEIAQMAELLAKSIDEGAFGLSFGFDYEPSNYAEEDELLALMRVVRNKDAVVTAHMQHGPERRGKVNKSFQVFDGFTEFLELGLKSGARIHVSDIYPAFEVAPGPNADILGRAAARSSLELIERYREKGVRITWDYLGTHPAACYFFPQLAWRLRPYVTDCGGKRGFVEALEKPWYRDYVINEMRSERPNWGKDFIIHRCAEKAYEGRSLADIAETLGTDCIAAGIEIIMKDPDTMCDRRRYTDPAEGHEFVTDEAMSFGTDNGAHDYDFIEQDGPDMPYIIGTPTEFGGMVEYFNTFRELPFEAIIKRMTGNSAKALRLTDRGFIKEGMRADIVVLDRDNLRSNLSVGEPRTAPDGVDYVIVNGRVAVDHKKHLHPRSGMFITKPE